MSVNFQLVLRFVQGILFLLALAGIAIAVVFTDLSVTDIFAFILAFVPTGWGILSVSSLHLKVLESPNNCLHLHQARRDERKEILYVNGYICHLVIWFNHGSRK